jgi:phosphoenolpyruvate carboxylase
MVPHIARQTSLTYEAKEPALADAIARRSPYVDPLSFLQTRLIREYREGKRSDESLRHAIRLSINAIASGLQVTG